MSEELAYSIHLGSDKNKTSKAKKLQKIIKTVKNILPDTLVCFTIVKDKGVREKQMA